MIVCHCHGITDRDLLDAGRARGALRRPDSPLCIAGSACGGCRPLVEELLDSRRRADSASRSAASPSPRPVS